MRRMSARFVGIEVGKSTEWVYGMWKEMGLVIKNKFGDWALTEAGRNLSGRISKSNHRPVPTFDFEVIEQKMIDFYNKYRKQYSLFLSLFSVRNGTRYFERRFKRCPYHIRCDRGIIL